MPDARHASTKQLTRLRARLLGFVQPRRMLMGVVVVWLGVLYAFPSNIAASTSYPAVTNIIGVSELRQMVSQHARTIESFVVEGMVCAVNRDASLLAIQDDSTGVIIEAPGLNESLRPGDRIRVTARDCAVTRAQFGIRLGTAPVVNNDGHHGALFKSGHVFLEAGMQPIRVTWFNGVNLSALKVEYEGPGVARRSIPSEALWRKHEAAEVLRPFAPGLDFATYTGNWSATLPDFPNLEPVSRGIATNFDLHYSVRPENSGLIFSGYLQVAAPGIYTFHVESDDGAYLHAGDPSALCKIVVLDHAQSPVPRAVDTALSGCLIGSWTELEGELLFAGQQGRNVELELIGKGGERVQATILESSSVSFAQMLHRRCRVVGILEALPKAEHNLKARLIVPGPSQVTMPDVTSEPTTNQVDENSLTSAQAIRHLTRNEAARGLPAVIKGVVIWSSYEACVLKDATGGVYIEHTAGDWVQQPVVGQLWEIAGTTDPGGFSPVIKAQRAAFLGTGAMPEPIHPTGEQLLNGSLDAEYVELRGVLTEVSDQRLTLLTAEGKVSILHKHDWPLPHLPAPSTGGLTGSIVRLRGCLMARVFSSRSEVGITLYLSPAAVEFEEFAPLDPFALPTKGVADLLRFDASAGALQRTKVRGCIIFAQGDSYCLQDGPSGCRVMTKGGGLQPGDSVEVVGFPRLGGPSPILQEALVKALGPLPLPAPRPLSTSELLDFGHDATMVQVEAILLEERVERDQKVLQLQAGAHHFTARMKTESASMARMEPGSRLRLAGVYFSRSGEESDGSLDAFQLWLRGPLSIEVLEQPPWLTLARALTIMVGLGGVLCLALVWITVLRRKVEERTAQLSEQIEQRQLVEQRRVMEQERTRVAQDLHDELGAGLTEVGLLGDLVKNPALPAVEKQHYLRQLTDIARSLVAALDEIVWAVNPHYDSVASLASYCTLFAQRFLAVAAVACRPQIPGSFPDYMLESKERHSLFLAFREALNNVVRHSGASEVHLRIDVIADELLLQVADNGHGFEMAHQSPGSDGIRSMRDRMEQLGGRFEIRSRPGEGTEISLCLPLKRPKQVHDKDSPC